MAIPLTELRRQAADFMESNRLLPVDMVLPVPENLTATGKEGYFRLQWSPSPEAADGYQIAISATQDIETPSIGLITLVGIKAQFADYLVGNIALTRYFAIRSFQGFPPRYYSDFSGVVSATSRLMTDAGSAEPPAPSSPPSTSEPPPSGSGGGGMTCWAPESLLRVRDGLLPIEYAQAGGEVRTKSGAWRRIDEVLIHEYDGPLLTVPGVGRVTPEHLFSQGGRWAPARELYGDSAHYRGLVYNLVVEAEEFDERSYEMAGGVVAHNSKAAPE
jgi:hypothetical protein